MGSKVKAFGGRAGRGRRSRYQLYGPFFSTRTWRCAAALVPHLRLINLHGLGDVRSTLVHVIKLLAFPLMIGLSAQKRFIIRCSGGERRELGMASRCKSASHSQLPTSWLTKPSHTRTFSFLSSRLIPTVLQLYLIHVSTSEPVRPALSSQMGGSQPGPGPGRPRS